MSKRVFAILAKHYGVIMPHFPMASCLDLAERLEVFSKEEELQLQGSRAGRG